MNWLKAADDTQNLKISKRWGTFANEGLKFLFREATIFKNIRNKTFACEGDFRVLKQKMKIVEKCEKIYLRYNREPLPCYTAIFDDDYFWE